VTSEQSVRAVVIGAGAWGTALATVLCDGGHDVTIWAHEPEVALAIEKNHENHVYLPGVTLPPGLRATSDLKAAVTGRELIVSVCPAQHLRRLTSQWMDHARPDAMIVCASKGIELGTGELLSQVFDDVLPEQLRRRVLFLSGPSFAAEVSRGLPTVVVIAGEEEALAERVQHLFARPAFRTYRSTDVVGVEVGGALKNVMAIATGICDGMGLGNNARAAIINRGLIEITRMAVAMGADPLTMMGLAGMGDLVLTCTVDLSRNRSVGKALGAGRSLEEVLGGMPQVVEGVATAKAAHKLAARLGVSTPIIDEVYAVLYEGASIEGTVDRLMTRSLKREQV
jgi:glycerol-3-phosphate dehydrogenase (NAD(P)+)